MSKNKNVWLIDDHEMSSYLTEHTLKTNHFSDDFRSFTNAGKALSELNKTIETGTFPDFIFLDLNMPVLDGWSFLKAYAKFPANLKEKCVLYILSSSVDEDDINKSKLYEDVRDFLIKPIDKMDVEVIKFQTSEPSSR